MFTGIIEELGKVTAITSSVLEVTTALGDIKTGDSVAVNGVCLTVTRLSPGKQGTLLFFDFSPETASRTNLGELRKGGVVNLERALKVGDRFGGHFLSGHVEGVEKILAVVRKGNSCLFTFSIARPLRKYAAPKGSVGIDGISLTVAEIKDGSFTVSVIPHTLEHTALFSKKAGDRVNFEPDMLAKYVENILEHREQKKGLTIDFFKKRGF